MKSFVSLIYLKLEFSLVLRDDFKKKHGLFNDIDHISFNTYPPPPKDDIGKND